MAQPNIANIPWMLEGVMITMPAPRLHSRTLLSTSPPRCQWDSNQKQHINLHIEYGRNHPPSLTDPFDGTSLPCWSFTWNGLAIVPSRAQRCFEYLLLHLHWLLYMQHVVSNLMLKPKFLFTCLQHLDAEPTRGIPSSILLSPWVGCVEAHLHPERLDSSREKQLLWICVQRGKYNIHICKMKSSCLCVYI